MFSWIGKVGVKTWLIIGAVVAVLVTVLRFFFDWRGGQDAQAKKRKLEDDWSEVDVEHKKLETAEGKAKDEIERIEEERRKLQEKPKPDHSKKTGEELADEFKKRGY